MKSKIRLEKTKSYSFVQSLANSERRGRSNKKAGLRNVLHSSVEGVKSGIDSGLRHGLVDERNSRRRDLEVVDKILVVISLTIV